AHAVGRALGAPRTAGAGGGAPPGGPPRRPPDGTAGPRGRPSARARPPPRVRLPLRRGGSRAHRVRRAPRGGREPLGAPPEQGQPGHPLPEDGPTRSRREPLPRGPPARGGAWRGRARGGGLHGPRADPPRPRRAARGAPPDAERPHPIPPLTPLDPRRRPLQPGRGLPRAGSAARRAARAS